MKNIILFFIAFVLISCTNKSSQNTDQKEEEKSESMVVGEVEKLAGDFSFTEGPAVDAMGNVYFTDIPNHLILI
jgi:gluconolactonase